METEHSPLSESIKKKLTYLLKVRYLFPFLYFAFSMLFWNEASHCYTRIIIMNFVIIVFISFSPGLLLQFDYLTVVLFFLWIFKNDNSETIKEKDPECLNPQDNLFLIISLWIFKVAIWTLTTFMVIIVVFLMISLIREFLIPPAYQGPGLSEEAINNLPLIKYSEYKKGPNSLRHKKEDVCPICLEHFELEEELRMIPNCSHVYHINCIKTWLDANTICPYCRGEVSNTSNSTLHPVTQRTTYTANIIMQLQEMSLLSDRENQANLTQPLVRR